MQAVISVHALSCIVMVCLVKYDAKYCDGHAERPSHTRSVGSSHGKKKRKFGTIVVCSKREKWDAVSLNYCLRTKHSLVLRVFLAVKCKPSKSKSKCLFFYYLFCFCMLVNVSTL